MLFQGHGTDGGPQALVVFPPLLTAKAVPRPGRPAPGGIPAGGWRAEVVAPHKDAGKRLFLPLPLPGGKTLVDPLPGVVDELEPGLVQNGVVPGQVGVGHLVHLPFGCGWGGQGGG